MSQSVTGGALCQLYESEIESLLYGNVIFLYQTFAITVSLNRSLAERILFVKPTSSTASTDGRGLLGLNYAAAHDHSFENIYLSFSFYEFASTSLLEESASNQNMTHPNAGWFCIAANRRRMFWWLKPVWHPTK